MADPRDGNLGYFNREAAAVHRDRTPTVDLSRRLAREIAHGDLDARMDRVIASLCARGLAPAALATPRPDRDADESALKAYALERGPAYAHPRRIFAVDALPVGGTGKIDREAVRERLLSPIAGNEAR